MRTIAFAALLLACLPLTAQHLRYKDIFPQFPDMGKQELKNTLKEYLNGDPDHPNANFRLALAYEKIYKTADPLTNSAFVLANADQAKLRFTKARVVVDEKEVNRNNDYYFQTFKIADSKGKPDVPFAVVAAKIKNGYDSADLCLKKVPALYASFTKSVNYYDKAVKIFAAVNNKYATLNDLYLYFGPDTDAQLKDLKIAFDSAKFFFDGYLGLLHEYPIPQHHQKYNVRQIVTYRLDGLITSLNFLTDQVELWDYAAWAVQIQNFVNKDIQSLRKKLNQEEDKIDQALKQIEQSADAAPVKVDKQLAYTLNNFDRQSLALSLLDYKAEKQHWLLKSKAFTPDTVVSFHNAENYSALIYLNRGLDTLAATVQLRLTPEKVRKHSDFFLKYYGSENGLQTYLTTEKTGLDKTYQDYRTHLLTEVVGLSNPAAVKSDAPKIFRTGRWSISTEVTEASPDLIEKGEPITLRSVKTFDGSVYLSGVYKADKKAPNRSAFLLRIFPDGKTSWIKTFENKIDSISKTPDAHNFIAAIEATKEGCAVMLRTEGLATTARQNSFLYFNDKGEPKIKLKLKELAYPRQLTYIEKSNSFILVLKGAEEKNDYKAYDPMVVMGLNILGDIIWKRSFDLSGTFTQLVNLDNGSMIFGNYMILKDLSNREHRTKTAALESNPFVISLGSQGDVKNILTPPVPYSLRVFNVIKVNDNSINLLGRPGTLDGEDTTTIAPQEKLVHLMLNEFGQVICTTF